MYLNMLTPQWLEGNKNRNYVKLYGVPFQNGKGSPSKYREQT